MSSSGVCSFVQSDRRCQLQCPLAGPGLAGWHLFLFPRSSASHDLPNPESHVLGGLRCFGLPLPKSVCCVNPTQPHDRSVLHAEA